MRILIVSQYFWPENFRINDLAAGLVQRGHEVTVLTGVPNYPEGRVIPKHGPFRSETHLGITIKRVPLIPRGNSGALRLALNYASFAVTASCFGPLVCRGAFDLVFVFEPSPVTVGIPAIVLKKLKRVPLFFWVQDLWPESLLATGAITSPRILSGVGKLVTLIYRYCDLILVQSSAFIPPVHDRGVQRGRIVYFPNSVEAVYRPRPTGDNGEAPVPLPTGFRIMFAGNIGAAQDFETVLKAAERLRGYADIHWIVLGDGRMRNWVQDEVKRLRLEESVHLLGKYPMEEIPRFLWHADALLVTLRSDSVFALTIPGKLQSYLACGRPIVGALDGESARIIRESGAGVAVPAGDATALADAVLDLYQRPEAERIELGVRGEQYCASHFSRGSLLDQLEALMREACRAN